MSHKITEEKGANKALHLTTIPLRSIVAGELCRYLSKSEVKV